jgi:hypothetical protein
MFHPWLFHPWLVKNNEDPPAWFFFFAAATSLMLINCSSYHSPIGKCLVIDVT